MLTKRTQIQFLADRLAGLAPCLPTTHLAEPYKTCWQALDATPPSAGPDGLRQALHRALQGSLEAEALLGEVLAATPGQRPGRLRSLGEMSAELRPIDWLWPGWLPRGLLTLLAAVTGAGKSFVALDLARCVLQGAAFPDGQPCHLPEATIIYVDAEGAPQYLNQRARSWGLDVYRLFPFLPEPGQIFDLSRPEYRDRLAEAVFFHNPALVILDSFSTLSTRGENCVEDVRELLLFLCNLACEANTGLLLIHHMRKSGGIQFRSSEPSVDEVRGSGHISAMARSVMMLSLYQKGRGFSRHGPRRLEIVKSSSGDFPTPLSFNFAPLPQGGVSLKWGEAGPHRMEGTRLEQCQAWLSGLLQERDRRPGELVELGKKGGFSRSHIYQARDALGACVQNTLGRQHPHNAWHWVTSPTLGSPPVPPTQAEFDFPNASDPISGAELSTPPSAP